MQTRIPRADAYNFYNHPLHGVCQTHSVSAVLAPLQVARKLVIIESDLERAEERAELSEG